MAPRGGTRVTKAKEPPSNVEILTEVQNQQFKKAQSPGTSNRGAFFIEIAGLQKVVFYFHFLRFNTSLSRS